MQIRGATLDGAVDGILFYITPEWDRLTSPDVWADAASQVFYSFGLACSSLVTFASYNHVNKFTVLLLIFFATSSVPFIMPCCFVSLATKARDLLSELLHCD